LYVYNFINLTRTGSNNQLEYYIHAYVVES